MTATITEATFRSSLGVRTGVCPGSAGATAQLTCDAAIGNGGQEIVFPVTAGETYRMIVDGQNVTGTVQRGRFTLALRLTPSGCGDTFVSGAEECDDGNTTGGDGCSATCTLETLPAFAACPGHNVTLSGVGGAVRRGVLTVNTTGLSSNTGSSCGGSGPEGIVRVVSDVDGMLEVRAGPSFPNLLLHARESCASPTSEIPRASCTSNLGVFTTQVQKNKPYHLFVDGLNGASGVAKLQFSVTP
ncbi:MAG: hypothetical protein KF819_32425 [Labilithrix sp.]|nr:hypothetical protein [Labilithrix sp.]